MKKTLFLSSALLVLCLLSSRAQVATQVATFSPSDFVLSLDVLSDTGGVDTDPYIKNLVSNLRRQWIPLAAAVKAGHPSEPKEETRISFTIAPDGSLSSMKLVGSTHMAELDKAAWNASVSTKFSPLPAGLEQRSLTLRAYFAVDVSVLQP